MEDVSYITYNTQPCDAKAGLKAIQSKSNIRAIRNAKQQH